MISCVTEYVDAEACPDLGSGQVRIVMGDETDSGRDCYLTPQAALRFAQKVTDEAFKVLGRSELAPKYLELYRNLRPDTVLIIDEPMCFGCDALPFCPEHG